MWLLRALLRVGVLLAISNIDDSLLQALLDVALGHYALRGFLHSSLWLRWLCLSLLWRRLLLPGRGSHLRLCLLLLRHHRLLLHLHRLLLLLLLSEHLLLRAKLVNNLLEMIKLSRVLPDPRLELPLLLHCHPGPRQVLLVLHNLRTCLVHLQTNLRKLRLDLRPPLLRVLRGHVCWYYPVLFRGGPHPTVDRSSP